MHGGFFTENHPLCSHLWSVKLFAGRRLPVLAVFGICLWSLVGGAPGAAAQRLSSATIPDDRAAKQEQPQEKPQQGTLETTIGILSRRSIFFPELAHQPGALSTAQKAELAADISVAPSRFLSSALSSAAAQARNAIPGYGQGWDAYGKRFGSSLATTASANVLGSFVLASAFHQDPRYFVAQGTFQRKIGNAFERVVVTRSDYGRKTPNWSGLLGDLFAESLANSYLPDEERTAGKTFQRYGVRVGLGAGVNIVREYWPYIFKRLGLTKWQPEDPGPKASPAKS